MLLDNGKLLNFLKLGSLATNCILYRFSKLDEAQL